MQLNLHLLQDTAQGSATACAIRVLLPAELRSNSQTAREDNPYSSYSSAASPNIWANGLLQDKVAIITGMQPSHAHAPTVAELLGCKVEEPYHKNAFEYPTHSEQAVDVCMCLHVTGGGAGIGFACVKALAQAGSTVVAVDIDEMGCRRGIPSPWRMPAVQHILALRIPLS